MHAYFAVRKQLTNAKDSWLGTAKTSLYEYSNILLILESW